MNASKRARSSAPMSASNLASRSGGLASPEALQNPIQSHAAIIGQSGLKAISHQGDKQNHVRYNSISHP